MTEAAHLFSGSASQTLISRITPTQEQRDYLQKQWNDLASYLKESLSEKTGYGISSWIQGSYKYGTLIRPCRRGEEYDVDVGVYFLWEEDGNAKPSPKQLRNWVQDSLIDYKNYCAELREVAIPPKERCSRASYNGQFHIDTPTYHLNPDTDRRRLACYSDKWEDSDPKIIYQWFKEAVTGDDRDQLRRLIRYLKAWAAVSFDPSPRSRPSSIFLTVLATQAYKSLMVQRLLGMEDEEAFTAVVEVIHQRLFNDRKVCNPIDNTEDLNRMSPEDWGVFLPALDILLDITKRAKDAPDEAAAALIWSEAFSFLMPLPETDQVEMLDEGSGRSIMTLPEIEIDVIPAKSERVKATYKNEVPGVAKDSRLVFRIINPQVIPTYATVEWTVRNEGAEAEALSDLGHRNIGHRLLETEEHTAYAGRHFMDCIVRVNGQVYAVRRVPVTIRDIQQVPRNPPSRPAYTKLRSIIRRRG